ncbi:MAG: phenylalanine--tRNA ligase subunit beta [Thermodesulfobacteriaceae bacterium]|nr:phenylalanine--tRNA ligase subunit beta [Thermodesulfobacteriaceae bacterium]MCX8041978.1 phenylalanine--tRNA ligase subunit beta [Thermodesulfobacteriaceae bacterium]
MRVPISWLSEFIDLRLGPEEVAEILTMGGIEVENIDEPYKNLGELITVEILEISFPEDLKDLVLCKVTDGKEVFNVFTTAKEEVRPGLIVGLAKPESLTFGYHKVEVKTVKGYKSLGTFLSPYEAGVGEEKSKLLIFTPDTPIGVSIYEVLNLKEKVLELAVTPNRGDVLSIFGVARELSLLTNWELNPPKINPFYSQGEDFLGKIEILDPEGCFRYAGRYIKGIEVKDSPFYLQKRLWLCGLRPINNIVDITNYVLLELGQPLHAFDWEKVENQTVIVRKAKKGEKVLTLDGIERILSEEDLVIADFSKPMVIAGVIGGETTGVSSETKNIFIESAWFNPKYIRRSSQRHKITTESSYRFERKVDPEGVILALLRATELIFKITSVETFSKVLDVYPKVFEPPKILLTKTKLKKYLGFEIPFKEVEEILKRIGNIDKKSEEEIEVIPFSYRQDLSIPEDLIEEIARIYGYEKIPITLPKSVLKAKGLAKELKLEKKLKEVLTALGFLEVITYSFIDPKSLNKLNFSDEDFRNNFIELANPLSANLSIMRTTLLPGLIEVACYNFFREINSLKIFEIGKVFFRDSQTLAQEITNLGILLMGNRGREEVWYEEVQRFDLFDLKGYLEELFLVLNLPIQFKLNSSEPFLKKGLSYDLILEGHKVGYAGEMKNLVLKEFDLKTQVLVAEIILDPILEKISLETKAFKRPPKFPSTFRDLTCIVNKNIKIGEMLEYIEELKVPYLEEVRCLKIYEGPPIAKGEKSVSLRFIYRAEDRTLRDEEVNSIQEDLVQKILIKFLAKPR